jgi:hypothetical protein
MVFISCSTFEYGSIQPLRDETLDVDATKMLIGLDDVPWAW